jgi:hypothetical protein
MLMETVLENDFMSMWYYPTHKIVHHQFHRYMFGEPLRKGLLRGAELLSTHAACKWLSDDRNNSALHPEDSLWCEKVWFPTALAAGWKYWAVVLPQKIVGQMNMRDFICTYSARGITAEVSSDPGQALFRLRRQ